MGALVDRATGTLVEAVHFITNEIRLAGVVEQLLGEVLLADALKVGSFSLNWYNPGKPSVSLTIYDEAVREDRVFIHRIREALQVPSMGRRLTSLGTLEWQGRSAMTLDDQHLQVSISAAKNGCEIKRIEKQVTRVRFETNCQPEDAFLVDDETEQQEGYRR